MSVSVLETSARPIRASSYEQTNVRAGPLFAAGCLALTTSAFTFVIRGDVLQDLGNGFGLSQTSKGWLEGSLFVGLALSMLMGGVFAEIVGLRRLLTLAFTCHLAGIVGMVTAVPGELGFSWLMLGSFLMGWGNGLADAAATPLVATLFAHRKTEYLNRLHAWYPAGLVMGGLGSQFLHRTLGLDWRVSIGLASLPCLGYGALTWRQRFPVSEVAEAGVPRGEMYAQALRPTFLLFLLCAVLAHGTEVAPQKWLDSVLSCTAGVSGTLVLVYVGVLMFVMRQGAGPIADKLTAPGMLVASVILAGVGLYLLSTATNGWQAFAFATIYGIGVGRLWPTLLGITAERFPAGGAFVLALLGLAANLSTSQVMPIMGHTFDHYAVQHLVVNEPTLAERVATQGALEPCLVTLLAEEERRIVREAEAVGAAMTYRWACVLPALLFFVLVVGVLRPRRMVTSRLEPETSGLA